MNNPTVGPRLELRQGQQLVMTAQLQQSIKLLQMSAIELQDFLAAELERNPLLMAEDGDDARDERENAEADANQPKEEIASAEPDWDEAPQMQADGEGGFETVDAANEWLDTNSHDYWQDGEADSGGRHHESEWEAADTDTAYAEARSYGRADEDEEGNVLEQTVSSDISLQDHLIEQLMLATSDVAERMVGARLIEQLDEAGYLHTPLHEIAEALGCGEDLVEKVLGLLQGCDPVGIFARNLSECLMLQLRDKDRCDPAMEVLLQHLDLLAAGKRDVLCKKCGVDADDLTQMIAEIKSLNPKPASGFVRDASQLVVPDVLLRKAKDGGWLVELNNAVLPRLLINRRYLSRLQGTSRQKGDKKYLTDQMNNANWLIKALDQRAQTLLKVATELVLQQDGFFKHGVTHLRPMTLRMIAEAVEVHESTVSRVTTNKYIGTPRGIFELKYFFTSSLVSDDAEGDISSKAVQHYIKELVDAEQPTDILSDDAIAAALQTRGIQVARRTVAKYRDILGIPSSADRRRMKKMGA